MSVLIRTAYYTVPLGVFTVGLYYWVKSDKTQARIKQNVVYHKPGGADPELIERNKRLIENITAITKGNSHVIINVIVHTIATIACLPCLHASTYNIEVNYRRSNTLTQ